MQTDIDFLIAIASSILVMGLLAIFIIYFLLLYRKKQRDFEKEREVFNKALLQTEIEIKEQTLANISRELHDNIGQIASLIKINLNLLSSDLSETDKSKVADSIELAKQLIKDVRALSVSLKSENLQRFGLIKMLEKDIERYQTAGNLEIQFSYPTNFPKLTADVEVILYRMSQEIFNNILKHANASLVTLNISKVDTATIFQFKDNGIGFSEETVEKGSGLLNLAERCKLIGAELHIQSVINGGTEITIKV
ncbi:MAG: histidine kinase [Putridiphycobacter sp.]|nr:histidine kinase [Putridiphycobacter sp.]